MNSHRDDAFTEEERFYLLTRLYPFRDKAENLNYENAEKYHELFKLSKNLFKKFDHRDCSIYKELSMVNAQIEGLDLEIEPQF